MSNFIAGFSAIQKTKKETFELFKRNRGQR